MAKLLAYVMLTVGLMVLFNLAGLNTNTGYFLSMINIGTASHFNLTAFWITIVTALGALVLVSGVKIGIIGAPTESTSAAAVAAVAMSVMIGDLVSIVVKANESGNTWAGYICYAIMIPIIFGFGIVLFDWARGND